MKVLQDETGDSKYRPSVLLGVRFFLSSPEKVDRFPPFSLTSRSSSLTRLPGSRPPSSVPPPQRMVAAGYLGKKTGKGFYSYTSPLPPPPTRTTEDSAVNTPPPYGTTETNGDADVGLGRLLLGKK
jgi:hypothetical protein